MIVMQMFDSSAPAVAACCGCQRQPSPRLAEVASLRAALGQKEAGNELFQVRNSKHEADAITKALPSKPFVSKVRGYGGGGPPQQVATPGPFLQPIPVLCRDLGAPGFLGSSGWVPKRPSNGEACPR